MALPPSLLTLACKSIETQQTGRCYVVKDGGLKVNVMLNMLRYNANPVSNAQPLILFA